MTAVPGSGLRPLLVFCFIIVATFGLSRRILHDISRRRVVQTLPWNLPRAIWRQQLRAAAHELPRIMKGWTLIRA